MRFIDLFAGIGLTRLGLESVGWRSVFANDIDAKKGEVYRRNFGAELPEAELLVATFPRQDLSWAGPRRGLEGDRSGLVAEALRLLQEANALRPRPIPLVLLGNVEGPLSSREGADVRHILESLGALGYGVDLLLIDAARFLPQSRRRVFVVGRWGGREHPSPPQPFAHPFRPSRVEAFVRRNQTALILKGLGDGVAVGAVAWLGRVLAEVSEAYACLGPGEREGG